MALNPTNLANDILADNAIVGPIPANALPQFTIFITRLSIHITEQIKRGSVNDVTVNTSTGAQNNVAMVE
jgi:hypothetical protein